MKKLSIIKCSINSKRLKAVSFFLRSSKAEIFSKKNRLFCCFFAFCQLAMLKVQMYAMPAIFSEIVTVN